MKKLYFFVAFIAITNASFANSSPIDSLRASIGKSKHDTTLCKTFFELGKAFGYNYPDSAMHYYQKAIEIAGNNTEKGKSRKTFILHKANSLRMIGNIHLVISRDYEAASEYYLNAFDLYEQILDYTGMSSCLMNTGVVYSYRGMPEMSLEYYQKALVINVEANNRMGIADCYSNIGHTLFDMGRYDRALESYLNSLKIYDELNDKLKQSNAYNNIGIVQFRLANYLKALEFYSKALEINLELNNYRGLANSYNNMGNVHLNLEEYDKAIDYYNKGVEINKTLGDKYGLSATYTNIGNVYFKRGNLTKVLDYYQKALRIKEELGDKPGAVILYNNIATLNISIADSLASKEFEKLRYLNESVRWASKAFNLSKEMMLIPDYSKAAYSLFESNKKLGNYKVAVEFASIHIEAKDSLFNQDKAKALTEMQTKYETEKKQQAIEKQQLVIEKQEIDNRRQRAKLNFTIGGAILLALLVLLIFRGYQQKRRSNIIISEKNALLKQANDDITSSIRYAQRIQEAIIPTEASLSELLGEHFVIFRPKDVVSGDFFWATRVNDWLIVTVADCTGHGVPGAFMSMLGMSFLNEIVRKKEIVSPSAILDEMRSSVIEALRQSSDKNSQKDGMDMSLVAINTQTRQCLWAGARNPLWVVRGGSAAKAFESPMDMVEVLKPDNQSVSINPKMIDFTQHEVPVQPGDRLYLFSDGPIDQFGGPEGRKFMSKQLKEVIASSAHKPLGEQKSTIEHALDSWMNPIGAPSVKQIDDITLICIAVN
jgi:tetratricopeptide (TPR) repeat protein/serine phosphatase RsbU (regulator of sigma subunit)